MPTISLYIREEDYEKWRAIGNPSEFIHNALNKTYGEVLKEKDFAKKVLRNKLKKDPDIDLASQPMAYSVEEPTYEPDEPHVDFLKKKGRGKK